MSDSRMPPVGGVDREGRRRQRPILIGAVEEAEHVRVVLDERRAPGRSRRTPTRSGRSGRRARSRTRASTAAWNCGAVTPRHVGVGDEVADRKSCQRRVIGAAFRRASRASGSADRHGQRGDQTTASDETRGGVIARPSCDAAIASGGHHLATRAPNASIAIGRRRRAADDALRRPRTRRAIMIGRRHDHPLARCANRRRTRNTPWFRPKTSGSSSPRVLQEQHHLVAARELRRADDDAAVAAELARPAP